MSESARPAVAEPFVLTRRRLLAGAVGLAALGMPTLVGCTGSDPRISSDGPRSSTRAGAPPKATPGAPPPPSGAEALASGEQALADLAATILAGPRRTEASSAQRRLLSSLREAHLQHVTALSSPQPTSRPASPAASATPQPYPKGLAALPLTRSLALLAAQESEQAARARRTALAGNGFNALLAGSISVAASSYASTLRSPPAAVAFADEGRRPLSAGSDVEAVQAIVRQLHALVYGYQLALGRLSPATSRGRRAHASLRARRRLGNRLEDILRTRSASVPVAAGAYVPSVKPTNPARSAALIRQMETRLLPFCGLWVAAAARRVDRELALNTLADTDRTARFWGAPLRVWPGWP